MDSVLITTWDDSLDLEPATRAMLNEGTDVQVRALPWKLALEEPRARQTRVVFALAATAEGLEGVVHAAAEVSSNKRVTVDGWLFLDPSDPSFAKAFAKACASERPHWVVQATDEAQWQHWAREALSQLFSASNSETSETGPAAAPSLPSAPVPFPGEAHRTELEADRTPFPGSALPSHGPIPLVGGGAAAEAEGRLEFPGPAASGQGPRYTYVFDSEEILAMRGEPKVEGPQVSSNRSNRTVILPSVDLSPSQGPLKRNLFIAAAVAVAAVIAFFVVG